MPNRSFAEGSVIAAFCASLGFASLAHTQTPQPTSSTTSKHAIMTNHASGKCEVKRTPQTNDSTGDANLGRMLIDKRIHGDLEAISTGQMLSAMTAVKGSAGYVAIEKVSGILHGRTGSFVLQHSGT